MCTFKSDPEWIWVMVSSWNSYINEKLSQMVGRMESPNRTRIQVRERGGKVPNLPNKWIMVERSEGRLESCLNLVSTDMEMISRQEAKVE